MNKLSKSRQEQDGDIQELLRILGRGSFTWAEMMEGERQRKVYIFEGDT